MRKVWSRIFLLCMACMICMSGLCLAANGSENWVKYYSDNSHNLSFYVDTNSIKTCEYGGHKYLDVKNASQRTTFLEFHLLLDVENRTVYTLEMENKQTNRKSSQDISKITQNAVSFSTGSDMEYLVKLLEWVEQNRPDVINEIRTFNHSAAPEKTDVTGTPNVPSSTTPNVSGDLHSLIYTPVQSEKAALAFCPLDTDGDISEIYRNPYKRGAEYKIISTFPTSDGKRGYYHEFPSFNYIPDDPDDPGAGGDFLFVDYYGYYMQIRKIGETAVKISWLDATQSSPQLRRPDEMRPYPEDTYELQLVTQGKVKIKKVPYRFVSTHGIIIQECKEELGAVFAVLDFLNEGNTLDMIADPPQGMALPGEAEDFKEPGKYRKTGTGVEAAR